MINLSAITIFLWHQTAMLTVTVTSPGTGRPLSGLHVNPDHPPWVPVRIGWVPVSAIVLVVLCTAFREAENTPWTGRGRTARKPSGRPVRTSRKRPERPFRYSLEEQWKHSLSIRCALCTPSTRPT